MVDISFRGGVREVGREAFLVENRDQRFLLDYGVEVQELKKPLKVNPPIDAVLLSHCHLDHSGNIPTLYHRGFRGRTVATKTTLALSDLLLRDSHEVQKKQGLEPEYNLGDVNQVRENGRKVKFGEEIEIKDTQIKLLDAGHVPGSASVLLEIDEKRILYTGDIKFTDTDLMKGSDYNCKDVDVLITESTYSYKNHPKREKLKDRLQERIQETVYGGGIALVPCFSVGRTQEMLCIVNELGLPYHLDGMGMKASKIIMAYPRSVKDHQKLKQAFDQADKIHRHSQRKKATDKPGVIISTSGMLNGGPIVYYLKQLYNRPDCSLTLTGYQVEGTAGRRLLETGRYINEGMDLKLKLKTELMDFSAHCGRDNLIKFIKRINPEKVFAVHGEHTVDFCKDLQKMGFDAHPPKIGETVRI